MHSFYAASSYANGGYSGNPDSGTFTLLDALAIDIDIGLGGASVYGSNAAVNGNSGTISSLGAYMEALGGQGGHADNCGDTYGYRGEGHEVTSCFGTNNDGTRNGGSGGDCGQYGAGGQSSGISKGGDGAYATFATGEAGGIGSGGGGALSESGDSGPGGNGQIKISWG